MPRKSRVVALTLAGLASVITRASIGWDDEYTRHVNGPTPMSSCLGGSPPCDVCPGHFAACEREPDPMYYPWAVSGGGCSSGMEEQSCTEGEYNCGIEINCTTWNPTGDQCGWELYCN